MFLIVETWANKFSLLEGTIPLITLIKQTLAGDYKFAFILLELRVSFVIRFEIMDDFGATILMVIVSRLADRRISVKQA